MIPQNVCDRIDYHHEALKKYEMELVDKQNPGERIDNRRKRNEI